LNFIGPGCDQGQALNVVAGDLIDMESIRPENPAPIPLRPTPPQFGTIMIRFVGLLAVAVAILAFVYSR
jgi:hypothetical protein